MRLACSTDPEEPVRRPRRAAVAPRAAMILGAALLALALLLALRTVLTSSGSRSQAIPAATTTSGADETPVGGRSIDNSSAGTGALPGATSAEPHGTGELLVHVIGAVHTPGVVRLPAGSRVVDAIDAAGGACEDAQTDQLNLARPVTDGEQVRVRRARRSKRPLLRIRARPRPPLANINTASADDLEKLPGIGPALAERIISHRQANGPFASLDDLTDVPGIGKAKLEALKTEATV